MNSDLYYWPRAIDWIFRAEGGYSDDPSDRGGATRFGISLRYLKTKGSIGDIDGDGDVDAEDIRSLTKDQAARFYKQDFWNKCRCGDLPPAVALIVFDQAVNTGVRTTSRMLQAHVKVRMDGIIGPDTTKAVTRAFRANPTWFISSYMGERAHYYHTISVANSSLAKFTKGWFNRLFELHEYVLEIIS